MRAEVRRIPAASKLGLVVLGAGALDIAVRLLPGPHASHHGVGPEQSAHVLAFAGMVLILAGVVFDGARRQLRQRAARTGGFHRHAHR